MDVESNDQVRESHHSPDKEQSENDVASHEKEQPTVDGTSPASRKRQRHGEGEPRRKKARNESSVVYVSRVPPGMDVGALRARLALVGTLGRVWLRKEEASAVKERRALGGRRRVGFQDGWVEFKRRREAKDAVALLNGQPMSGARRGGRWANDLWCLRLLPRDFTWQSLIEDSGVTPRQHVLRVKAAVAASRRERHLLEEREALARRIARRDAEGEEVEGDENIVVDDDEEATKMKKVPKKRVVRRFKQREVVLNPALDDIDELRARAFARKLEQSEGDGGAGGNEEVDGELLSLLFENKQ